MLPSRDVDVLLQQLSVVSRKLPLLEEVCIDVGTNGLLRSTDTEFGPRLPSRSALQSVT